MAILSTIINQNNIVEYVPGFDITTDERILKPYLVPAHKSVATVIGFDVFNEIASMPGLQALDYLRAAVANRLMYDYKVFETIQKRQAQKIDTFKYELESMQATYLDFYFDSLDSLIRELEELDIPGWKSSPAFETRQKLLIKTTDEFNSLYGIDGSDFFYFKTIFLQQKVMDTHLAGIAIDELEEDMFRRVKRITAVYTVAYALRQFDFSMLPKTIRNSTADGASRYGSPEQNAMYNLSEYLFSQAESDLSKLLFELNAPEPGSDIPSENNLNDPRKKFFLWS